MPGLRYRLSTQLKGTGSRYRTQTSSGVWLQTPDERKTKFQQFNWSLRLIREHNVRWYTRSRFGKVQQGRTAFLLCPTSDGLKTKNRHTNKHKNQQIKQKQRQNKTNKERILNYYCNDSFRCHWGWVFTGNEWKETWVYCLQALYMYVAMETEICANRATNNLGVSGESHCKNRKHQRKNVLRNKWNKLSPRSILTVLNLALWLVHKTRAFL